VKTTIEIPGATLRRAKTIATSRGISLKQFFTEALEDKLKTAPVRASEPAWLKLSGAFGRTASDRSETRRIQKRINAEFEVVEPEDTL
jgi:hypothetical protein